MKLPVVAIVGRPNVGKSTFFNRIIQRREAIVDDLPGVTRDRNYAIAEWAGRQFILIDTGGYVPGTKDIIEKAVFDQAQQAIAEADVIVFMVDAKTGVAGLDEEIAIILQKSGKAVVVAVNKIDNQEREQSLLDFYGLGLGDPYAVSAIGGRNIGDFLDQVIAYLPEQNEQNTDADNEIRLAVLGRPNVGKSSFVNVILGENKQIVTDIPGTTRDAIDAKFTYHDQDYVIIDTAGIRKKARVKENVEYYSNVRALNAMRRSHVAIILIDATEGLLDQDKSIILQAVKEKRGIVVAINKWDLVEKETMTAKRMEDDIREKLGAISYLPFLFISVLEKQRVDKVIQVAKSIYEERAKRIQTSDLNKFLQNAIQDNHPPSFGSKWVKLNYCSQVRSSPPVFVFFTNEPRGIRNNYKGYLENRLRQQFGFLGVPITMQFRKK